MNERSEVLDEGNKVPRVLALFGLVHLSPGLLGEVSKVDDVTTAGIPVQ